MRAKSSGWSANAGQANCSSRGEIHLERTCLPSRIFSPSGLKTAMMTTGSVRGYEKLCTPCNKSKRS